MATIPHVQSCERHRHFQKSENIMTNANGLSA